MRSIQKANFTKTAAELFATNLRVAIRQRTSPAATGTLANSVKAVKRSNKKYGVKAGYYFWYANYGRRPGRKPSAKITKLNTWANKMGFTGKGLRTKIAEEGTHKILFYETAKKLFKQKRKKIWKDIKIR